MGNKAPINAGNQVHLIDGFDLGMPGRTGTYVLQGDSLTLVETGPSPSVPHIIKGLKDLQLDPDEVKYIVLTHIHLDHAGGAGLLLKECPQAQVIVHQRGSRHLADPSKLIAGARAVYGDAFDELFDPVLPIPEERITVKGEGDTLTIGENRVLEFFDTPGHAKHHLGIYDSWSNGIFTGDTVGIRYHQTEDCGVTFHLPSTSPNQFDPEAMQISIDRVLEMNVDCIYFGHFGKSTEPERVLREVSQWIPVFVEIAEKHYSDNDPHESIQQHLHEKVTNFLNAHDVPDSHPVYEILKIDLEVCTMGLIDYLNKKKDKS
ncbi:MBL fold metallo-hydrolase [Thalassobacillus pellis]|uniref:MBL fold metallo-hydrolase n=1 Tax=Thalassobacillus pellis TaxID=748008 RepID=UPI001EF7679A|nr:MBL fold metallo-hydrolase [Thalassobacillus pellis]MBM7552059.1 glyoxylase-like metal-dependent hydrolase (beta-lactamase superfamily II) [Thalassobacillus pellis]